MPHFLQPVLLSKTHPRIKSSFIYYFFFGSWCAVFFGFLLSFFFHRSMKLWLLPLLSFAFLVDGQLVGIWYPDAGACVVEDACCCVTTRMMIISSTSSSGSLVVDALTKCISGNDHLFPTWTVSNNASATSDAGVLSSTLSATITLLDEWHLVLTSALSSCPNYFTKDGYYPILLSSSSSSSSSSSAASSYSASSSTGEIYSTFSSSYSSSSSITSSSSSTGSLVMQSLFVGKYRWDESVCVPSATCACPVGDWTFHETLPTFNGSFYGGWGSTSMLVITTRLTNLPYALTRNGSTSLQLQLQPHVFAVVGKDFHQTKKRWCVLAVSQQQQEDKCYTSQAKCVNAATTNSSLHLVFLLPFFCIFFLCFLCT